MNPPFHGDAAGQHRKVRTWPMLVPRFVAVVLLAAAGLKLAELLDPSRRVWLTGRQQAGGWAGAIYELLLAAALVWGRRPGVVWAAAVATFLVFAGVAAAKAGGGAADCGCFGAVKVDPRLTLLLDLSVLTALLAAGPAGRQAAAANAKSTASDSGAAT